MRSDLRTTGTDLVIPVTRRLPIGAEPGPAGVHFRVWAPDRERVEVLLEERRDARRGWRRRRPIERKAPLKGRALFIFDPDGNEAEVNTRYLYGAPLR